VHKKRDRFTSSLIFLPVLAPFYKRNKRLRLHLFVRTFRVIIVSTPIHFLLRSISQWRSFRYTTPWGLNYSHSTLTLSEDASPVRPCGIKGFSKNYTSTWDLCVQWTAHYYVVTFHSNLTDTFPYCNNYFLENNNFHKLCVVDCESSGPSRASLSFEQQNTQLLSEMSPFPYFKTTSKLTSW